jgi:uncharacterized phage protein gp47/JayE
MTLSPRPRPDIFVSLRDSLQGRITKLTNFTERSFNFVWNDSFARELRDVEVQALASQLSGYIEYAGGPILQSDLAELGIQDSVSVEEINEYMEDEDLDELVKLVGVERSQGTRATGAVDFTTESGAVTIPEGTTMSTETRSAGDRVIFETTEPASTSSGATVVTDIEIQAVEPGADGNLPAGEIRVLPNPPIGVIGVTNPSATEGGQDREPNRELRERAARAVEGSSEGGTVSGIRTFVESNVEGVGVGDVFIDEFFDEQPPFVDVIVSGGTEDEARAAIDTARPAGIRHNLLRPQDIVLGISADIAAAGLSPEQEQLVVQQATAATEAFINDLAIGEDLFLDKLSIAVVNSISLADAIIDIDRIRLFYQTSVNESYVFDVTREPSDQLYRLDYTFEDDNGTVAVRDSDGNSFTEGVDFQVINTTPDGKKDTIQWLPSSGTTPEDRKNSSAFPNVVDTRFFVDYDITVPNETKLRDSYFINTVRDETIEYITDRIDNIIIELNEFEYTLDAIPDPDTLDMTEGFRRGEDFTFIDTDDDDVPDTISWNILNDTPDDGVDFIVEYDGVTDTITFNDGTTDYSLSQPLETDDVRVRDTTTPTYTLDTAYQLAPLGSEADEDTLTYSDGTPNYALSEDRTVGDIAIIDDSNAIYTEGTDYRVIDTDGDTFEDSILWDDDVFGAVLEDGGLTTDYTTEANDATDDDVELLPASPAEDDAFYVGAPYGFDSLTCGGSTAGVGTWAIVWEYFNGTEWAPLANVSDGTSGFTAAGENAVTFDHPRDWATTDVGGISDMFWVRARVDSFTSITTQPLGDQLRIGDEPALSDTTPADAAAFTVNYNGFARTIRFDQNETIPSAGSDVFVLYEQQVYQTDDTILGIPTLSIFSDANAGFTQHDQDVDFEVVDLDRDDEDDAIRWLKTNVSTVPDRGDSFYVTYATESNILVDNREKVESGDIDIKVL